MTRNSPLRFHDVDLDVGKNGSCLACDLALLSLLSFPLSEPPARGTFLPLRADAKKVGLAVRARPPPLHGLLEMRYSSLWWLPRLSRSRSLPLEISCVTSAPSLACAQLPLLSAAMAHIHDSHNTASFGRASPLTSLLGNPPSGPSVFRRESSDSSCTSSGSTAPSSVDLTHCALSDEWASLENHTNAFVDGLLRQRQQADVALAAWQVRCQTLEEEVARLGIALDKMEKERDEARAECAGCRERGMVDEKVQVRRPSCFPVERTVWPR